MENKSTNTPQDNTPRGETKFYGGIKLNNAVSAISGIVSDPQSVNSNEPITDPNQKEVGVKPTTQQVPHQTKPEQKNSKPDILNQLKYAGFAVAISVVVVFAVVMFIFSLSSKSVNAAALPQSSLGNQVYSNELEAVNAATPTVTIGKSVESKEPQAIQPTSTKGVEPVEVIVPTVVIVPAAATLQPAVPPVVGQGGTCISGSVIDIYHNLVGAGLTITLSPKGGGAIQTIVSDSAGHFQFSGLPAGTYTVTIEVREGWKPITLSSFDVVLNGSGFNCAEVRFKFELPGCVVISKLNHDKTGNTVGIAGWTIVVSNGSKTIRMTTNSDGEAFFPNLEAGGIWSITEELRDGWWPVQVTTSLNGNRWVSSITDFNGYPVAVTNDAWQSWWSMPIPNPYAGTTNLLVNSAPYPQSQTFCQPIPIVNKQILGSIVVKKVNENDQPLQGWKIDLIHKAGTLPPRSAFTDKNGLVCFKDLDMGEWIVSEELRAGWVNLSTPTNPINITQRQDCTQVVPLVFKNKYVPTGCIDGYKINDLEEVLSGWTIQAVNQATNQKLTTMTNSQGYYLFPDLVYGTWEVSEILQSGWTPVTPSTVSVTVDSNSECKHVRFKNRTDFACLDVYKRDAFDGVGIPGWNINIKPAFSASQLSSGITDGTGWIRFDKLIPGEYDVAEIGQAGWHSTDQNNYRITLRASGSCGVVTFCNLQDNMFEPYPRACIPGVMGITPPGIWIDTITPTPLPACSQWYTVKPGDTFSAIARTFGISIPALGQSNPGINPSLINPNMQLCIPWPGNG